MKIKVTKEMREKIHVGIIISAFTLILYVLLTNFSVISNLWGKITSMLFPFIIGFALAFLLDPIVMFFEKRVFANWHCKGKGKRTLSMLLSLVIAIAVVAFLFYLIVPAVIGSVSDLVSHNEIYITRFTKFITDVFEDYHLDTTKINEIVGKSSDFLTYFADMFTSTLPTIVSTSYGIIKALLNILIGVAAAMYLLLDKEVFISNVKKINFAILPKPVATYLRRLVNIIKQVFYDFIVGKAIDSLIIGVICYIGLSLLGIKYAALLSVIVGITNMIPVFGPFIGAIPGIFILLIIQPIQSLYFVIFILILQQFDGNILGPLILGDKLGLPSFWILFSVTLGGALFNVVGMFIGVPTFAVIYYALKEYINLRLEMKQIDINQENTL
ncbi:MAG: AI-2E family transporter [Erysipelotrichia bacterium]|nr:AI-2E family transporter [Erysipelotrichia bacterium]NCC54531.1 AI-2E family transporter [Erysipelotrichia bacterium]